MMEKSSLINMIINLAPGDGVKEVNDDTSIIGDLNYDSLAMVELLNEIEERFGVDFTELPDFLERFECVGDIWEGIELLLGMVKC